ncbi:hypothetical protein [Larkinella arboricola]
MDYILKIIAQAIALILSLVPSYFNLIQDSRSIPYFKRVTMWGWIAIGVMCVLFGITWYNEYKDEQENSELKRNISDIKTAVQKAGLTYDSTSKAIINIGNHIGPLISGNSQVSGLSMNNNSINVGPNDKGGRSVGPKIDGSIVSNMVYDGFAADYTLNGFFSWMDEEIRRMAKQENIPAEPIYLYAVENTTGAKYLSKFAEGLSRRNLRIMNCGTVNPEEMYNRYNYKIPIDHMSPINHNGRMVIVIGNVTQDFIDAAKSD